MPLTPPASPRRRTPPLLSRVRTRLEGDPAVGPLFPDLTPAAPPAPARSRRKPQPAPPPPPPAVPDHQQLAKAMIALAIVASRAERARRQVAAAAAAASRPAVVRSNRGMGGKRRQLPAAPAAPTVPVVPGAPIHGVRHWQTNKEILPGGRMRISCPQARGWAVVIRPNPATLYAAELEARGEATKAGQAMWRGERYELDALTEADDPTEPPQRALADADELAARAEQRQRVQAGPKRVSYSKHAQTRPDVANPAHWTPNPDGTWSSPKNSRRWGAHTKNVRRVLKKRGDMGLSVTYEEYVARQRAGAAVPVVVSQ